MPNTKQILTAEITQLEATYAKFYERYSVIRHEPIFNQEPAMKEQLLELITDYLEFTTMVIRARRELLSEIK